MSIFSKYIKVEGDKTIWTVVILLLFTSVLVVASVEGISATKSHIRNIIMGLLVMYAVHKLKFKYFSKLSIVGIVVSIFLLLFVLVLGPEINGAKRWVSMGGLSFQPSDFAKIMLLIFMSRQISKYRSSLKDWKGFIWYLLAPLVIICSFVAGIKFPGFTDPS